MGLALWAPLIAGAAAPAPETPVIRAAEGAEDGLVEILQRLVASNLDRAADDRVLLHERLAYLAADEEHVQCEQAPVGRATFRKIRLPSLSWHVAILFEGVPGAAVTPAPT